MDGPEITIERPTDLYALLDWAQSQMLELSETKEADSEKCNACAEFITLLMGQTENAGFGNMDDVDSIEY